VNRAAAAVICIVAASCAGSRATRGIPAGDGPLIGVYRATIDDGTGVRRHAKLLLWAEPPDRLHAELLAGVGGVRFVLDAGGGAACVVDVSESTAYAGDAGPAAVDGLVGVRVSIEGVVGALLSGVAPPGVRVERGGGAAGELPEWFTIAQGDRGLELKRVRFERGSNASDDLGTGRPPARMRVRPIEDLPTASGSAPVDRGRG
jgi:hypothetical protein